MSETDHLRAALADRYVLQKELGAGGMATVYLARDTRHDREVAVKVLRPDLSAVIGSERFLAEVRIAAKLDHPHILTLIDSGSVDGLLYYVMPYVRGESLRAKINREKQLDVNEAVSIAKQVASALDYAHARGVVHRDIKPENILLHEGEAVLADFGIALAVQEGSGDRLTQTGLSLGTPQYMSPEQATGDRSLDKRSDVYSLGAVFYEMISGEPPVTGATAQAMIAKLMTEKPVKLRIIRDTISRAMEGATEKALAKVPADRFSSAGEFVQALSASEPEVVKSSSPIRPLWLGGAVTLALLIAAGIWLARGHAGPEPTQSVTLRDRTQITNTGRVMLPDISDDGKTLAYVTNDCSARGCRYGIEMQDIASGPSRRLLEGAMALYGVEISPDRRNVLLIGAFNGVFGSFIVSALGGPPRSLLTGQAAFWAGGDSLMMIRNTDPSTKFWILVAGLDGVPVDSIRVDGPADELQSFSVVPASQRIIYSLTKENTIEVVSSDRAGKRYGSLTFSRVVRPNFRVSADAMWVTTYRLFSNTMTVMRFPFDANGHFGAVADTIYTGISAAYSVTADGGTLVMEDGTTEFTAWKLSVQDLIKGRFPEDRRFLSATNNTLFSLSPDGVTLAIGRDMAGHAGEGRQWTVAPYAGGAEVPIPGRHASLRLQDSVTVQLVDESSGGTRLSLVNLRTRQTTSVMTVPDSAIADVERLPGKGWAWVAADRKSINVQNDGDQHRRRYPVPAWYRQVLRISSSPDGSKLAFVGWNAPGQDSLGIGLLSLHDGRATQLMSVFAENAALRWQDNGVVVASVFDTPESMTFYRVPLSANNERLGSTSRPLANFTTSRDLKQALVVTRDHHGDAWMSRVVKH